MINMKKNKIVYFLLLMLLLIVSCGKNTEEREYEVTKVERGDISLSVENSGKIVSEDEISVYTTASLRVNKVFFKAGDNVKKGDVVLTFYPLDKNEIIRKIEIKRLEIQQKNRDLKNLIELQKVGGTSKTSIDDTRITLKTAQLELASLEESLTLMVDQIVSPVDGVITQMTADENYRVNTETTLFKVSDSKNMKAEVSLADNDIKNIAVGQKVYIVSDALQSGNVIEGVVSSISGVSEKSSTLDESTTVVNIALNDSKNLRPGTTINANIIYNESKNVLKIPYSSVINENGKFYAFVVGKDNKISKREVTLGITDDQFYEVKSGVKEGEEIIRVSDEILKDGEKVKILRGGNGKRDDKGRKN